MKTTWLLPYIFLCLPITSPAQAPKPNIVLIIVDDLNDYVQGFNGQPQTITPNMLELQQMGVTFLNGYCNAPGCAPSRTSMLSGKDMAYTKVYSNSDYDGVFRDEFTVAKNNEEVFTLPEILKDNGGYYTYAINKVFHSPTENDYDDVTADACSKSLSWNKMVNINEPAWVKDIMDEHKFGDYFTSGAIPDSLEKYMEDYKGADSAIQFIHDYASGTANTCGNPFFLALGMHEPHEDRYVPEKYFPTYYKNNFLDEPFHLLFNNPADTFPYNGVVMPPQPAIQYEDYYNLPEGGLAQQFADVNIYEQMKNYVDALTEYPVINDTLTDEERKNLLYETVHAGYLINYLAAIQFSDAQIGRVIDALKEHPELIENTVIILIGDNGYSLGEKRHWTKWTLWEPDIRIPFIIVHPDATGNTISNRTVSMLDLFPTICNWANTDLPTFSDGSDYVDGTDFSDIVFNPQLNREKPVLSTYKKKSGAGSCFPHHSVRNEKFHYIRYRSNNDGSLGGGVCNADLSITEEELYEVGANREKDANEWNNLIGDANYKIVKEYLGQWLPDSSKYLQPTYTVKIKEPNPACYYKSTDVINLSTLLYDKDGVQLFSIPAGKHLKWWTNIGTAEVTTLTNNLNLSAIPEIVTGTATELKIYLALYNSDYTEIDGLDLLTIKINNTTTNYPSFKVKTNKRKATIKTMSYPAGTFTAIWDYGDGFIYTGLIPPAHMYAAFGTYTINCSAVIGSAAGCTRTKKVTIILDSGSHVYFKLSPNPAQTNITLSMESNPGIYELTIFNAAGVQIIQKSITSETGIEDVDFNIKDLVPGVYYVQIKSADVTEIKTFIKAE
ncbi:MAG: sulfatase-like hydrolase/transferase [Fimbriimonadaceae bacterium]|nr:sulfatase-like hydrolase/transferase [Chitinophagales bacterium]